MITTLNIITGIFTLILSTIFFTLFIKSNIFKENVRHELNHKQENKNTATCGGLVFGFITLIGISSILLFYNPKFIHFISVVFLLVIMFYLLKYKLEFFRNKILLITAILLPLFQLIVLKGFSIIQIVLFYSLLLGFYDDMKKSYTGTGMSEGSLMIWQCGIGLFPILYRISHNTNFNFFHHNIDVPLFLLVPFLIFVFNGTVNGVNMTDGINGGLGVSTLVILLTFLSIGNVSNTTITIIVLLFGSLVSFLYFNLRGKIFMGNIGSMFIGSFIATFTILNYQVCYLPLIGLLFVLETLSVIIQVISIKKFKKKILLFSPFHHHFELLGWQNWKILGLMTSFTIAGCGITLLIIT